MNCLLSTTRRALGRRIAGWRSVWGCLALVAAVGLVSQPAAADMVRPAGVAASSFYDYQQHPLNLINDATLTSPTSEVSAATSGAVGMWHAGSGYGHVGGTIPVVANQQLIFTLPGTYDLTGAHIWQMNQAANAATLNRGVNGYDLLVSSDGVNFTPAITSGTLAVAPGPVPPGTPAPVTAQSPTFTQNGVRFVKLDIHSAHSGAANDYVGLSEVHFEGTQVSAGPVMSAAGGPTLAELPRAISSSDLLQGKIGATNPSLVAGFGPIDRLTDGLGGNSQPFQVIASAPFSTTTPVTDPWQITYDSSALGLAAGQSIDLSRIDVYSYNTDARRVVDYDVAYTLDGTNWEYLFIGAANGLTAGNTMLSSIARADEQTMVSGVTGLRFDFRPVAGASGHSALLEIDAFGAIVPEPSSFAILGLGALVLGRVRRKQSA